MDWSFRDFDYDSLHEEQRHGGRRRPSPGKVTLTSGLPPRIHRKASSDQRPSASAADSLERASQSSGEPLPAALRESLEQLSGSDLSGVRAHTGPASAEAAKSIHAHAYTTGRDIHFAAGRYEPHGKAGQRLIAHEVAHTLQHGSASSADAGSTRISDPGDAHEQVADEFGGLFEKHHSEGVSADSSSPWPRDRSNNGAMARPGPGMARMATISRSPEPMISRHPADPGSAGSGAVSPEPSGSSQSAVDPEEAESVVADVLDHVAAILTGRERQGEEATTGAKGQEGRRAALDSMPESAVAVVREAVADKLGGQGDQAKKPASNAGGAARGREGGQEGGAAKKSAGDKSGDRKRDLLKRLPLDEIVSKVADVLGAGAGQPGEAAKAGKSAEAAGLRPDVRSGMQHSFGEDFSNVEVAEGGTAARHPGVDAVSESERISFAPGKLDQKSEKGRALIGEELAHVVQKRRGSVMRDDVDEAVDGGAAPANDQRVNKRDAGASALAEEEAQDVDAHEEKEDSDEGDARDASSEVEESEQPGEEAEQPGEGAESSEEGQEARGSQEGADGSAHVGESNAASESAPGAQPTGQAGGAAGAAGGSRAARSSGGPAGGRAAPDTSSLGGVVSSFMAQAPAAMGQAQARAEQAAGQSPADSEAGIDNAFTAPDQGSAAEVDGGVTGDESGDAMPEAGVAPQQAGAPERDRLEAEAKRAGANAARGQDAPVASGARAPEKQFGIGGWLRKKARGVGRGVKKLGGGVSRFSSSAWGKVKNARRSIGAFRNKVRGAISSGWNKLTSTLGKGASWVEGKFDKGLDWMRKNGGVVGRAAAWMLDFQRDFQKGVLKGAWGAVSGLASMAYHAGELINPAEWIFNPENNLGRLNTLKNIGGALLTKEGWSVIWDGIKTPFVTAWKKGDYGEAIGLGAFEIVSLIFGTKGLDKAAKAAKAARAASAVSKVGAGTRIVGKLTGGLQKLRAGLSAGFGKLRGKLAGLPGKMVGKAGRMLRSMGGKVRAVAARLGQKVRNKLGGIARAMRGRVSRLAGKIRGGLSRLLSRSPVGRILSKARGFLSRLPSIVRSLLGKLRGALSRIAGGARKIAAKVRGKLAGVARRGKAFARRMLNRSRKVLTRAKGWLSKKLGSTWKKLANAGKQLRSAAQRARQKVVGGARKLMGRVQQKISSVKQKLQQRWNRWLAERKKRKSKKDDGPEKDKDSRKDKDEGPGKNKSDKEKKKKKDDNKERARLRVAAGKGWRRARGATTKRVLKERRVESILRGVPVRRARLDVKVAGKQWKVRARWKGRSASSGSGWVGRDTQGKAWLAARSQERAHARAFQTAETRANEAIKAMAGKRKSPRDYYQGMKSKLKTIESDLTRKPLLDGIAMDIKENQNFATVFKENNKGDKSDDQLVYDVVISPNAKHKKISVNLPPNKYLATKTGGAKKSEFFKGPWDKIFQYQTRPYQRHTPPVHPVNQHYTNNRQVPEPTGNYHVAGQSTMSATKHTEHWRDRIDKERDEIKKRKKAEWLGANPGATELPTGVPRQHDAEAKREVEQKYGRMGWRELRLEHEVGPQWEGHHIEPVDWGGSNQSSNIIYLPHNQHKFYEPWFRDQKKAVRSVL